MANQHWRKLVTENKARFEAENGATLVDLPDFVAFESALEIMYAKYSAKPVSTVVREKLAPHFDHIRSFERAISASSQSADAASLIWGGLQMVLEVSFSANVTVVAML